MKKGIFVSLNIFPIILSVLFPSHINSYEKQPKATFAFSDIFFWKFRAASTENWAQEISPIGTNRTVKVLGIHFNWNPGLRLGIGHNSHCDDWNVVLSNTWFQTKRSSEAAAASGAIYSSFLGNFYINNTNGALISGPVYSNASIQWKLLYNIIDLELGRKFKIDEYLKLRPFIGLKGGVINHRINSSWQNPIPATTFTIATDNLKNNFWGIGPSLGLDTTWLLCKTEKSSFNLFANVSGAILAGQWHFKERYENNAPASVTIHESPIKSSSTMTRAHVGMEWARCFSYSEMTIRLGYEAQVWFNQMQFYSFNMGRLNNLMSLQGGALSFSFNF